MTDTSAGPQAGARASRMGGRPDAERFSRRINAVLMAGTTGGSRGSSILARRGRALIRSSRLERPPIIPMPRIGGSGRVDHNRHAAKALRRARASNGEIAGLDLESTQPGKLYNAVILDINMPTPNTTVCNTNELEV